MWNFETRDWKSKADLSNIYLFTDLQYQRVVQSVKKYECFLVNASIDQIDYRPKIKTATSSILLSKATSKYIYNILLQEACDPPTHELKIQEIFNELIDWRQVYLAASYISKNVYLLQTQFKLTHNILPSNQKLFQWKVLESPLCVCSQIDTNLHYIVGCSLIKPFWEKLLRYLQNILGINFPISEKDRYFGIPNPYNTNGINSINYILLVARTFIWTRKNLKNHVS